MYPNLLEAPCGENLHIVLVDDKELAARLEDLGIGVDTAIVKIESSDGNSSDALIRCCEHAARLKIPPHQARQIYVRICEVCWSCGECRTQEL